MALRFRLQLVVVADDDQQVSVDDLVVLTKEHDRLEQVGLTLGDRSILSTVDLTAALEFALRVSAFTCTRPGADPPRRSELADG